MTQPVKILGYVYVAVALVVFGAQLPIREASCLGVAHCALSFIKAPVWATIWPVYVFYALPPTFKGMAFVAVGVIAGCLLGLILSRYDSREAGRPGA